MTETRNLEGLGGWLILVGLGVVLSPVRIIVQVFPIFSTVFSDGTWEALTVPGSAVYNPLWAPILLGELAVNVGSVVVWVFIAFLFFSKKSAFPKWFIGMILFTLCFIVVDAISLKSVLPNEPVFDADTLREVTRTAIATLIWVPYMLVSKRVKATFVN